MAGYYGIKDHSKDILGSFVSTARASGDLHSPIPLERFLNLDDAEDKVCLQYLEEKGLLQNLRDGCASVTLDGIDFFEAQ